MLWGSVFMGGFPFLRVRLISQCARDALGASRHVGMDRLVEIEGENTVLHRDCVGLKGRDVGDAIGQRSP